MRYWPKGDTSEARIEAAGAAVPTTQTINWAGDKFDAGFGPTQILDLDYWSLRERSAQMFRENMIARGIIRRLVTAVIGTGLYPEMTPEETVLGFEPGALAEWSEWSESLFYLFANNELRCDFRGRRTFPEILRQAYREALIEGDVLIVMYSDDRTGLPKIDIVNGGRVSTPFNPPDSTRNEIKSGVEIDDRGHHVAFWVEQDDNTHERIPAFGKQSGRRVAWLVYGTDKRMDDVRGEPLLSILLNRLKDVDRYGDSTVRRALIASLMVASVQRDKPGVPSMPIQGGATRRSSKDVVNDTGDGASRKLNITQHLPGMILESLAEGEKLVVHNSDGTDVNYGDFLAANTQLFAWALEIPPEFLRLSYNSNYAASQGAREDIKKTVDSIRSRLGADTVKPFVREYITVSVITNRITANGFLEAYYSDPLSDEVDAWLSMEYVGPVIPSNDIVKTGKGYAQFVEHGWFTNSRAARETTGTRFSKNIRRIKIENEMKVEAARVLVDFENEVGAERAAKALKAVGNG